MIKIRTLIDILHIFLDIIHIFLDILRLKIE